MLQNPTIDPLQTPLRNPVKGALKLYPPPRPPPPPPMKASPAAPEPTAPAPKMSIEDDYEDEDFEACPSGLGFRV